MATYKVSYGMLKEQGEALKKLAKVVDGYAQRVNGIKGKLGSDKLLESVRSNLSKLETQLGESRTVLNTAGELLQKTTESYAGTETRGVKKVDSLRAHNRDFYKNPVTVASAGAATGAAASAGPTVNYTDNSTTVNYYAGAQAQAAPASPTAASPTLKTAATAGAAQAAAKAASKAATKSALSGAAVAVGAGLVGGAAGAGVVEASLRKKGGKQAEKSADTPAPRAKEPNMDDLETQLEAARARARLLGGEGEA